MMKVTIQEQLKSKAAPKEVEKKTVKLTDSDLRYLMGINRTTYSRGRGGAWRNGR